MPSILITGASGFVGGAVVEHLLRQHQKNELNLLLLVRAQTPIDGLLRIRTNLEKFGLNSQQLDSIKEENILIGDLSEPDAFTQDNRIDNVTHVINCAAIASFGNNPALWRVNVDGSLAFAQRMAKVKSLKRFVHVGTAMASMPDKDSVFYENMPDNAHNEDLVQYTASKRAIENLIREHCPDLPFVVARPSIIVGHTLFGCRPSSSIFWVFLMALKLKKFTCHLDSKIDVIPVDYCAMVLVNLCLRDEVTHNFYHISSGEEMCTPFYAIDEFIAKANNTSAIVDDYQQISYQEFTENRKQFKDVLGPCNDKIILRAIKLYGGFAELNVKFDNQRLLDMGIPRPMPFTTYIDKCVSSTRGLSIPELMMVDFK
ncbi:NAD-dependent epimerase/dehydratase family protein [Rouxiella sp. S1S-2]|uniref:SDR family oxidoreductase n=1 Tax=Rouxiella sp. S1S-2 TaxID=2653856 RepID=UPI001264B0C5|nr:SDR family oxidoreductase [Rouxiella sp. S1S-2]KAB7898629.1 NAD-dependent epimerase/dehydratase family protein [Rouxiella sp. S1S-2]